MVGFMAALADIFPEMPLLSVIMVIMTVVIYAAMTVAMIAGMIPTAVSITGDAAWRAPMGTTVIGGLMLSTVLTLLIVPACFSLADGVEKRLGPALRRRVLSFEPEHALDAHGGAGQVPHPAE